MVQSLFAALFVAVSIAAAGPAAAAAEPTLHEVYQAAERGDLKQAEAMMDQVLRDHPNSAKAHFVEAELLAKEGRADMAKAELATAERLSPGLAFTKPESVQALKARLSPATAPTPVPTPVPMSPAAPDSTWVYWLVGLLVLAAFAFFVRSLMRPRVAAAGYGYAGGAYGPAAAGQTFGANPMGPVPGAGGGLGSSMLGGLATGVAVGAGVAAGEALMHRVLDGGHSADAVQPVQSLDAPASFANDDMGGADFGVSDGGSWDDGGGAGGDWN